MAPKVAKPARSAAEVAELAKRVAIPQIPGGRPTNPATANATGAARVRGPVEQQAELAKATEALGGLQAGTEPQPVVSEPMDLDKPTPKPATTPAATPGPARRFGGVSGYDMKPDAIKEVSSPEPDSEEESADKKAKNRKGDADGDDEPLFSDDSEAEEEEGEVAVEEVEIKPLREGEKVLRSLPQALHRQEIEKSVYPPSTLGIHGVYRRAARPRPAEIKVEKGQSADKATTVGIIFRNNNGSQVGTVGGFNVKDSEDKFRPKLSYIVNSACPGFKVEVKLPGKKVTIVLLANALRRQRYDNGTTGVSLFQRVDKAPDMLERVKDAPWSPHYGQTGCLWELNFSQYLGNERAPFGAPALPASFVGITTEELDALVRKSSNLHFGNPLLTQAEWTIVGFRRTPKISIYKAWQNTPSAIAKYQAFDGFWAAAMEDAALNGNFPHYQRQAAALSMAIDNPDLPLSTFAPSREMVRSWRVKYEGGDAISAKPENWASYDVLEYHTDPQTLALAHRIGIERSREREQFALQEQLDDKIGVLLGELRVSPFDTQIYWLDVRVEEGQGAIFGSSTKACTLAFNTNISVEITEGDYTGIQLSGSVKDDAFGRSPQISAALRIRGHARLPNDTYKISISLKTDGTSANRQNAAMCEIGRGVTNRTVGVDIASLVLGSAPTIATPNSLALEVARNSAAFDKFEEAMFHYTLNPVQKQAADASFKAEHGALLLWGPPGTGKTTVDIAIAVGHILVGKISGMSPRPICATASSNAATANLLKKYLKYQGDDPRIRVCLFRGARAGGGSRRKPENAAPDDEGEDSDDDEGVHLDAAIWQYVEQSAGAQDPELEQYYFPHARKKYIRDVATDRGHQWSPEAKWYREAKYHLAKKAKPAAELKTLAEQVKEQEWLWDERFIQSVDLMLCTNNSAAHETLGEFFKPRILISDEAAQCSVADVATPMAVFKETLEMVLLSGDHKQQGPISLSKGRNECYKEGQVSLFERVHQHGRYVQKFMLKTQHRMKEAHSEMINEVFYSGELDNHPDLGRKSALERTIESGLSQGLDYHWSGRLRLSADVSGPDVKHEAHEGSRSIVNVKEAWMVIEHIKWLLSLTVPYGGRAVTPDEITVISPYNGQVSLIRQLIAENGVGQYHSGSIKVLTTAQAQGTENQIVCFSWVVNDPEQSTNIRFTRDPKQICVNFSRVITYQATFANWKTWMQAEIDARGQLAYTKGKFAAFPKVVRDHRMRQDAVSRTHMECLHSNVVPDDVDAIVYQLVAAKPPVPAAAGPELRQARPANVFTHFATQEQAKQKGKKRTRRGRKQGQQRQGDAESDTDIEGAG